MSRSSRVMRCRPSDVWAVLADGWSYGLWVVGAARVRDVDPGWPDAGAGIHHSVGVWPALVHDTTRSTGAEAPHRLQLRAQAWLLGGAAIDIRVEPHDQGCVVTIDERLDSGPAALVPSLVQGPALMWRNSETLRRLSFIAEGRSRP
ncbi:MAG TPA: SRPBCC family protein [Nocardioidaceae bacterium]|nr:SRPBCC family protein [Nocardioidaceae bacterium]